MVNDISRSELSISKVTPAECPGLQRGAFQVENEQRALACTKPLASVIIPCLNAAATLAEQLEALSHQVDAVDFEVIIVDNGSTDDSLKIARDYAHLFFAFSIVDASALKGAGQARNAGVKAAKTDFILFCDADDVVDIHWVGAMTAALANAQIVGGHREWRQLNPAWHPVAQRQEGEVDVQHIGPQKTTTVGAGNMGIRRDLFEKLGGFDPMLPIHEDADLCLRAHQLGVNVQLCSNAIAHIRVRHDVRSVFRQARNWGFWHVLLYKKHRAVLGRPPIFRPLFGWAALILDAFKIRNRAALLSFTALLGWKLGRLIGSVEMWYLAL